MNNFKCSKGYLLSAFLFSLTCLASFGQSWEVYDQNLKLTSRIEYGEISILGETVRISSIQNNLKLLSKEYRPFLNLKGESIYQYLEPWIIVKGPQGLGAFHEYGEEVFGLEYDQIQTFYTRLLAQKADSFWIYDRTTKETRFIGKFESALLAKNGQIIAKTEQGYTLPLSENPKQIFRDIREVNENFLISNESTGYGIINRKGDYVLDPIIDHMIHLEEDFFYAYDGKQYMLIKAREERSDINYTSFHKITFENGILLEYIHGKLRRVMKNDGILLDQVGMEKVTPSGADHFNIFLREKKTGLLGPNGWVVNPQSDLDYILPGNENLFAAHKDGKFGFVNKSGKLIIQNRFDTVSKFSEGLAAIKLNGNWGFVDENDRMVISSQFDEATDFFNGLSKVKQSGKFNLIDQQGNLLLEKGYNHISLSLDNYYLTEENGFLGLISPNGKEIIPPKFDELRREAPDRILVRIGDKYGIMDENGNYVLPIYYKNILFDKGSNQILAEDQYQFTLPILVDTSKKKRGT